MANRKSLGPILVLNARGKLAGAENRNEYFFSVVRDWNRACEGGWASQRPVSQIILSFVDEPTSVSDRVASARPVFPDLNGMF
jgi:hypothetical protein